MARYVNPVTQYTDSQGELLVEGFLRFEESGTNTLKPIFADVNLSIPLTNPVKLDGAGRVPSVFLQGVYKVTAFKNDGIGGLGEQQWERDPVGGETGEFGADWDSITQYSIDDIVRGSDDKYYISITSNNTANDPTTTPSAWSQLNWFTVWNTSQTYSQFNNVRGSDGLIYYSVLGSNQGNDPTTDDGTNWLSAGKPLFRGALIDAAAQSISSGSFISVQFASETYDTDGIHDNVTNNTRMTVPAGVSRIRLTGYLLMSSFPVAGDASISLQMSKNGSITAFSGKPKVIMKPNQTGTIAFSPELNIVSAVIDVVPGDFFEMDVSQNSGGPLNASGWASMEIIE